MTPIIYCSVLLPSHLQDTDRLKIEETVRNTEFEKNNGDFCNQYLDDMKVREKAVKKKQDSAESNRLKGKYVRSMILCYQ